MRSLLFCPRLTQPDRPVRRLDVMDETLARSSSRYMLYRPSVLHKRLVVKINELDDRVMDFYSSFLCNCINIT